MAYVVYRCLEESFGKYLLKSKWILRNRRQTCKQLERLWVTTQKWQNATFPLKGENCISRRFTRDFAMENASSALLIDFMDFTLLVHIKVFDFLHPYQNCFAIMSIN